MATAKSGVADGGATLPGRRERKKAQTRQAISDAALRLFLERGYDAVTVAEVAQEADTAVATVFKHFPDGKPALIFDDGVERRAMLVAAIRNRPQGQSPLNAMRGFLLGRGPFVRERTGDFAARTELIVSTPALSDYSRRLWVANEGVLADEIATASGRAAGDTQVRALARYVLEVPDLAGFGKDPAAALNAIFDLLETGWEGVG